MTSWDPASRNCSRKDETQVEEEAEELDHPACNSVNDGAEIAEERRDGTAPEGVFDPKTRASESTTKGKYQSEVPRITTVRLGNF